MKKVFIAFFLLISGASFAQDKTIMNYNGHWYVPGANNLDKEALKYQQLITEKSSFDSLAKRFDVFVTRTRFSETVNNLENLKKEEVVTPDAELSSLLRDFSDMVTSLRNMVQSNDEYRRFMNTTISRVLAVRHEGWSNELYRYILRESIASTLDFYNSKTNTDNALRLVMNELNADSRFSNCRFSISVDSHLMDDPDMQLFVCDNMEYILGADIYRYRESTPGVVSNYTKRKKESTDLYGWLLKRATQDRVKFIAMVDFNHNTGSKANEAVVSLSGNTQWYVFLFYKGLLYYSDIMPKCGTAGMNVPYKQ